MPRRRGDLNHEPRDDAPRLDTVEPTPAGAKACDRPGARDQNNRPRVEPSGRSSTLLSSKNVNKRAQVSFVIGRRAITKHSATERGLQFEYNDSLLDSKALVSSHRTNGKLRAWVRRITDDSSSRGPGVLLLHGPSGSGKSAALRTIAHEEGVALVEWFAPCSVAKRSTLSLLLDSLEGFLQETSFPSLPLQYGSSRTLSKNPRRLVVIDDFPCELVRDREDQLGRLKELLSCPVRATRNHVAVVLSDMKGSSGRIQRALRSELLAYPWVEQIHVPAATDTAIRRAIRSSLQALGQSSPSSLLDSLVASSGGDLRSALNTLSLLLLGSQRNGTLESADTRASPAEQVWFRPEDGTDSTTLFSSPVLGFGRDATLDTFHAVSKVLNNKRQKSGDSAYDADELLREAHAEAGPFVGFLFWNYQNFFADASDVCLALESLSECDQLLRWTDDATWQRSLSENALATTVRAFLHFNNHPVRSGWRPIVGNSTSNPTGTRLTAYSTRDYARESSDAIPCVLLSEREYATDIRPMQECMCRRDSEAQKITFPRRDHELGETTCGEHSARSLQQEPIRVPERTGSRQFPEGEQHGDDILDFED